MRKRWLAALLLLVACAPVYAQILVGILAGSPQVAAGKVITNAKAWTQANGNSVAVTLTTTYTPQVNDVVACVTNLGTTTATPTVIMTDTLGVSTGSWTTVGNSPNYNNFVGASSAMLWKVVIGTPSSNPSFIATWTQSSGIELYCAVYRSQDGSGTWSGDAATGNPYSAANPGSAGANPAPGNINTAMTNGLIIGSIITSGTTGTAGTGYTASGVPSTRIGWSNVEDNNIAGTITSTAGNNNPGWTMASTFTATLGMTLKLQ